MSRVTASRVRNSAWGAGLAASLLLFFSYQYPFVDQTGVAQVGIVILSAALRFGGWAMAGITVWLVIGHRAALLADAIVTALIGAAFVAGAGFWILGGLFGYYSLLYVVFGIIFLGAARTSFENHRALVEQGPGQGIPELDEPAALSPGTSSASGPPAPDPLPAPPPQDVHPQTAPSSDSPPAAAPKPDEQPPEGFLAGFAGDQPEDDPDKS